MTCSGTQFDERVVEALLLRPSTASRRHQRLSSGLRPPPRSGPGAHHASGRRAASAPGSSSARTRVASTSTASAVPTATSLMKIICEKTNAPIATANSSAAAVMIRPLRSRPMAIASSSLRRPACLGDPAEQEDPVVGRQPEDDREQQDRDRDVEGADAGVDEQRLEPPVLEEQNQDPERDADRERVGEHGEQRQDQRARHQQQRDHGRGDDDRDRQRQVVLEALALVGELGARPRDLRARPPSRSPGPPRRGRAPRRSTGSRRSRPDHDAVRRRRDLVTGRRPARRRRSHAVAWAALEAARPAPSGRTTSSGPRVVPEARPDRVVHDPGAVVPGRTRASARVSSARRNGRPATSIIAARARATSRGARGRPGRGCSSARRARRAPLRPAGQGVHPLAEESENGGQHDAGPPPPRPRRRARSRLRSSRGSAEGRRRARPSRRRR